MSISSLRGFQSVPAKWKTSWKRITRRETCVFVFDQRPRWGLESEANFSTEEWDQFLDVTAQQRQETHWVIACSPWAQSLLIALVFNADLFFSGVGDVMFFWQNPGAGAAQNLKNCLGHNSVVSSWVTLNVSSWLKSDSFLHTSVISVTV